MMDTTSEPSPLSLGTPRRMLLPRLGTAASDLTTGPVSIPAADKPRSTTAADNEKPRLPPLQRVPPTCVEARSTGGPQDFPPSEESVSVILPTLTKSRPAYAEARFIAPDLSAGPPMLHRLSVLGESLMLRAPDTKQFKVVAVDGTNRNVVHLVIASLHYQITKDLRYTVRVVSDNSQPPSSYRPTAISTYLDHIRDWGLMWAMMLHTHPTRRSSEHSVQPALYPATSYPYPLVYILPLSPFMATLEASKSTELAHHPHDGLWRWLAGHWAGHLRPDITVILRENNNNTMDQEVLRVEGENMRTLLVTNVPDGEIDLTPAQLRRITFEVEEWLYAVN